LLLDPESAKVSNTVQLSAEHIFELCKMYCDINSYRKHLLFDHNICLYLINISNM